MNKATKSIIGVRGIIGLIVSVLLFFAFNYFCLVKLNFSFGGIYWMIIALSIICAMISWDGRGIFVFAGIAILTLIVMCIVSISGSKLFNAKEYRSMLGEVTNKTFSNEISEIDMTQLPTVDADLAKNIADKKLGSETGLGSIVRIKEGTLQNVNGELMYVFPLLHSGFFKYMAHKDGTSGYITVSATDSSDVHLVQQLDGKDIKIKYQPEAKFSNDLYRYVYNNYSKTIGLTDYTFEIDDSGVPYWTVTKYDQTIGFGGEKVIGLLTVNAMTGEIVSYDLDNVPSWVDRVYPKSFIEKQINDYGKLINGAINWSGEGKTKLTEGDAYLYNNGDCFLYSGITSVGADESTTGFMLTDLKTHDVTFYKIAGATENAGKSSMEGKVQQMGYTGEYPYLINVEGVPTYFSPLKDKKGLVKMYGFCSVQDYSIVGVGESLKEAKTNYTKALHSQGNSIVIEKSEDAVTFEGTIERIGMAIDSGSSNFYMVIKEMPGLVFIGSQGISQEMPFTQVGDKVQIGYNESESFYVDLMSFDNLTYTQNKSDAQLAVEAQKAEVEADKAEENVAAENESLLEKELTPEQQKELNDALKEIVAEDAEKVTEE